MKRPVFIARQSARPAGLLGRLIANIMAHETADLNERAVRLLEPSPSDWVLEIGFGHGRTIDAWPGPFHRAAFAASMSRVRCWIWPFAETGARSPRGGSTFE
jgi:hypothetical protein